MHCGGIKGVKKAALPSISRVPPQGVHKRRSSFLATVCCRRLVGLWNQSKYWCGGVVCAGEKRNGVSLRHATVGHALQQFDFE